MVGGFMGSQQEEAYDAHEAHGVSLLVSKGGYGWHKGHISLEVQGSKRGDFSEATKWSQVCNKILDHWKNKTYELVIKGQAKVMTNMAIANLMKGENFND